MERTRMILTIAMTVLVVVAFCGIIQESEGEDDSPLSIERADYDPSLGTLSIGGKASSSSVEAYVTSDDYVSQFFSFIPVNGQFSGLMKVGDLNPGIAKVVVFTSTTEKAERSFTVSSLHISSVSYDSEKGIVSVTGLSDAKTVELFVKSSDYTSQYYSFLTKDGSFSGEMNVGVLASGVYEVTAFTSATNVVRKTFTVAETTVHATGISLDKHQVEITADQIVSLTATLSPSNATDTVVWKTSNNLIVAVNQNGILIPKAFGKATITAKVGSFEDSCEVSVGYAPLSINKTSVSLYVGDTHDISITVPSGYDASDKSKYVWRIDSGQGKITLDTDGNTASVSANYAGTAVVSVIYDKLYKASCEIKMSDKPASTVVNEYIFNISMDFCADIARTGNSGFDAASLKKGIVVKAMGTNAGTALEKALKDNNIPCEFFTGEDTQGNNLQHWVGHIFGLGDYQYENGAWRYWIQYYGGQYNLKTLGYYTDGGTFTIVYGMTSGDSGFGRIRVAEIPTIVKTYTGSDITLPDTSSYKVVSGGTAKNAGTYDAVLRLNSGYAWEDATFEDKTIHWIIKESVETTTTENSDGSTTVTDTHPDGTIVSTTTSADGRTVTVVKKDAKGNETYTKTETSKDGSTVTVIAKAKDAKGNVTDSYESVTIKGIVKDSDGNTVERTTKTVKQKDADDNVKSITETVNDKYSTKDKDGNVYNVESETVVNKDKDGKPLSSSESVEVKDKNGNIVSSSVINRDAEGKVRSYEKTEVVPEKTYKDDDGNTVKEYGIKTDILDETGKRTVREESSKTITKTGGVKESEKRSSETVTQPNGSISTTKVTERTSEDDTSTLTVKQIETKDAKGNESFKKSIEAESKDGSMRSSMEISEDTESAEIVTSINLGSGGGSTTVTADDFRRAVALQERVSKEISDLKGHGKIIQVESPSDGLSLSVPKDAMKAVSDSDSLLRLVSEGGSLLISKEVMKTLSQSDDLVISISGSAEESMNDAQKEAVNEGSTVVEVKITSGDKSLGNSLNGKITMVLKHSPADGKVPVAYYISDDGRKERQEGAFDPNTGTMTVILTHCSIYAVIDEEPVTGLSDDNTLIYLGVAAAVLAIIIIAIVVYSRKNQKQ